MYPGGQGETHNVKKRGSATQFTFSPSQCVRVCVCIVVPQETTLAFQAAGYCGCTAPTDTT